MFDEMDSFEDLTFSQLELCSYRYLQQVAKSMGVPCNVKKVYLIEMIRAKKYCNPSALEAIIERIRLERQQQALKKPRRKKKRVQGTEITSTSQSPPVTTTPKRRYVISYPHPVKDPRMNILRPTISKKAIESDRVLRSFNMRMRPNYSILNVNSSVLGVIRAQGALYRSEEEREYPLSMFQRQQLFVRTYPPRQKAITVEDRETLDDGGRQLVPVVRNINTPSQRPAKRQRQLSGIYPLNLPETYYRCSPSVNIRRQDGSISKINALVYRSNEKFKENQHKNVIPLKDVIPDRQVRNDLEANSSTESANSTIERQISAAITEVDFEREVRSRHTQTGPYKTIKHTKKGKPEGYTKDQRVKELYFTENCNYEPEVLIHTEQRSEMWNEKAKNVPDLHYIENNPKDCHRYIENKPKDYNINSESDLNSNHYTGNNLRNCYQYTENQSGKERQRYQVPVPVIQNKPEAFRYTENKEPNGANHTEHHPDYHNYTENQNVQPRNYDRSIQDRAECNNDSYYTENQSYSNRCTENRDSQSRYVENHDPRSRYADNRDLRSSYPENHDTQTRYPENHDTQARYPENHDSQRIYVENHDTRRIYAENQDLQTRYPENHGSQPRYAENHDTRRIYAENHDPQIRYVENHDSQPRYVENHDSQRRYEENQSATNVQARNEDYPNMSALTDVYPDNHTYTELSSNARGHLSVYYHKKIRGEQVRNTIQEPRTEERLPRISDVFSQFNDVQYKHLTRPLYVEVNQESNKTQRSGLLERRGVVLEGIYNLKHLTEPILRQPSATDTHCVYSTPTISTPLPQHSTAFGAHYEYGPPNQYPYNMESETMPRLYDYVKMAEQERQHIMCDEVLSTTDSLESYRSQELGANVTIPDMVEDAMELISQDGDYMERIGMDVKISCIACNTWAGPNNMLEYHIRKDHSAIINRVQSEWSVTFPLASIWNTSAHRVSLLQDELYVLTATCVRPHALSVLLCTLPTVSEDIPKYCRLGMYQKGTNNPFIWEGEITQLTDDTPYNENGLKIDINSLKILPSNVVLVNEKLIYEYNGKDILEEELRGVNVTVFVKVFD